MDVAPLVPFSVLHSIFPPHRLGRGDEKALFPAENKSKIVVLVEVSRTTAWFNEAGCKRRSAKYLTSSCYCQSLNGLLQTPCLCQNTILGRCILKPRNNWIDHVSVLEVVFQPKRRDPHRS